MTSTLLFFPVTVKLCCQGITPVPLRSLFEYRDGTRLVFEEDDKEQLALFEQQITQQFGLKTSTHLAFSAQKWFEGVEPLGNSV